MIADGADGSCNLDDGSGVAGAIEFLDATSQLEGGWVVWSTTGVTAALEVDSEVCCCVILLTGVNACGCHAAGVGAGTPTLGCWPCIAKPEGAGISLAISSSSTVSPSSALASASSLLSSFRDRTNDSICGCVRRRGGSLGCSSRSIVSWFVSLNDVNGLNKANKITYRAIRRQCRFRYYRNTTAHSTRGPYTDISTCGLQLAI